MPRLLCGVVILLTACSAPAPSAAASEVACGLRSDEQVSLVSSDLKEGEHQLQDRNYQLAIHSFRTGMERLGAGYAPPNTLDDTGQRLVLAGVEESKSHHFMAAHLLYGVLSSRLNLCEMKRASAPPSARRAANLRRLAWNS